MRSYKDYLARKQRLYGDKFDPTNLPEKFVRFYENQARIEVKFAYGDIRRGRIGITTGWKPAFLLMATVRSTGSSDLLAADTEVLWIIAR